MPFNQTARFKQMKPLVREFFRALQGLSETEMGKAAFHILHVKPMAKRCWVHPKIVFTKPKIFVPSCYTMKEWTENRKKKTTIIVAHLSMRSARNTMGTGGTPQG